MRESDFTQKDKDILAKRVAFRCSNPGCRMATVGPNEDQKKSTNIGVAAHIKAASKGGPRYDKNQSEQERKDIANGIWLCQSCSVLIDRDEIKYTVELLNSWKSVAEHTASKELNKQMAGLQGSGIVGEFGYEPIEENAYYEKEWQGGKIRYYLKDGLIHVEHELEPDCIAYYVVDNQGNLIDTKLPYPIEEYDVEIDPNTIIRQTTQIIDGNIELKQYDLKWGRKAMVYRDNNGKLLQVNLLGGGATISNVEKKFLFKAPEFKQ